MGQNREPMPPAMMTAYVWGMWAIRSYRLVGCATDHSGQVGHLPLVPRVVVHPVPKSNRNAQAVRRSLNP